ncbi:stigma-specific STIG1 family protein [Tanacetum coccineum]|uniref:Stigma-specific STIG1 family protein n=1 Tax=Tanacetum coccineum TaxID=301880 RepID=A0ABQ4WEX8_9ASTR
MVDVVVPVESIRAISESFANTAYGFFLGKRVAYPIVANYFIRNHSLILKKWNLYVNLLKEDVGNVPVWVKLHGVPVIEFSEDCLSVIAMKLGTPLMLASYTSDMCLQSWGRSSYARAMIKLWANECPKNPVGFKLAKEYRPVSKNPTANTSGNKKKGLDPTKGNVETSSTSTTPIVDKIGKLKKLIVDGKVTLVDDDGKPLKKVNYPGDHDSEHEVESVDNDMARSMASKGVVLALKVCWKNGGILMRMSTISMSIEIRLLSNFLSTTAYSFKLINTAYPLPLDTAYRSSRKESEILEELIRVS